jgi:PAS domain S-box-containing protein
MSVDDFSRVRERLASVADPVGVLTQLCAHAPVALAMWRPDGRPVLATAAFVELFGTDQFPTSATPTAFERAVAGETVHVPTFWHDQRVAIAMTVFPVFKPDGALDGVAATCTDQTELVATRDRLALAEERERRAEETRGQAVSAARAREEDLRITLDSIGDGVIATDAAGHVTRMNPVAEHLTGWTLGEAVGQPLTEIFRIVDEETGAEVESPATRVIREGKVVGLANHTALISRDGITRTIADSGAPIRDDAGALRGVVLVFHDQTERAKAERAVRDAAARLQVLAESSRHFATTSDIHDLLSVVARRVGEVLGEICTFHLVTDDRTHVETVAIHHPDPEVLAATRELLSLRTPLGEGITGRVAATGEPIFIPVIPTEKLSALAPRPEYRPVIERLALSGLVAVPLRSGGTVIGVLHLLRSKGDPPFTPEDQRLAQDLADRAALAIQNARLIAALEQQVAALRRSEARFRRLVDAGILGIIVIDGAGNIREANAAFLNMVGYTADELLSGSFHRTTLTPPDWRHLDDRASEQLAATGIAPPWEKEYFRRDGTRIPVSVGVAVVDRATNEAVAFVHDLTERKRAETAARESEARKAAVMEAALDAIVLMDHHGRITDFNPAAERTFGYARDEVIGRPLADVLVPPHLRDAHRAGLTRYLATGEGPIVGRRIEVSAVRKTGAEFPVEIAIVRIGSDGPPVFTGYIRDITERRKAAEAETLRRAKEAAEHANAELEAFSYSVAHDLRAPLRAINGFATALRDDSGDRLDAEGNAYLRRIIAGAERMAHLIDALLELARLTRAEARRQRIDLAELATAVFAQLRATDPSRAVELVVPPRLAAIGDPQLLRVLVENLLGNSWKFTGKRPAARIEIGYDEADGAYFVRDNGAGFDMALIGKLFAPFRRLHTVQEFEGTGIGLATVQRIVHRHGGRIWAEAVVDQGATFHFTLPGQPEGDGDDVRWTLAR